MKPTAYKWTEEGNGMASGLFDEPQPPIFTEEKAIPLYTAHQIADFVRGLYFDDTLQDGTLTGKSIFTIIADKLEEIE